MGKRELQKLVPKGRMVIKAHTRASVREGESVGERAVFFKWEFL